MNKANLFIVGTAKAGTSYVYNLLKTSDDVFTCKIKEPNFFYRSFKLSKLNPNFKLKFKTNLNNVLTGRLKSAHDTIVNSEQQYSDLFENFQGGYKYYAEASISYLHSSNAHNHIYQYNRNSKIIICVRNPIDRLLSHLNMDFNNGLITSNFEKEIYNDLNKKNKGHYISNMYIELGYYYEHINNYLSLFGKENVLILQLEDLKNDNNYFIYELNDFLKIKLNPDNYIINKNESKSYRIQIPNFLKNKRSTIKYFLKKLHIYNVLIFFLFKPSNKINLGDSVKNKFYKIYEEDYLKTKNLINSIRNNK